MPTNDIETQHNRPAPTREEIIRERERRRRAAIRRKKQMRRDLIVGVIALLVIVIGIVLIVKICSSDKTDNAKLNGIYVYDQYTEYEFDGKGNGCMCIDKTNHYEFTYRIEKDALYVDYALDYVTDCEYTLKLEDSKMTLIGGKGTSEPGKTYELTKKE